MPYLINDSFFDLDSTIEDGFGMEAPEYVLRGPELHRQWVVRPGKLDSELIGYKLIEQKEVSNQDKQNLRSDVRSDLQDEEYLAELAEWSAPID